MLSAAVYEAHIENESARFLTCLTDTDPGAAVPTCPDWTAADLLWHLTEVQRFWTAIVGDRLQSPDSVFAERRTGPEPEEDLAALFAESTAGLLGSLANVDDGTPVWTWSSDQTVGFVRRRQAHEALIHRLDAESIAGHNTPINSRLATDGIDEVLRIMHGGDAQDGFAADGATCRLTTTDTGAAWDLAFGAKSGGDGFVVTSPGELVSGDLVITHDSAHLVAWLWGRGSADALECVGDKALLARLEAILATGHT